MTTPAGWYPDPTGRHGGRYWDGNQWTEWVHDEGVRSSDPLTPAAPAATEAAAATATPADHDPVAAAAAEAGIVTSADDSAAAAAVAVPAAVIAPAVVAAPYTDTPTAPAATPAWGTQAGTPETAPGDYTTGGYAGATPYAAESTIVVREKSIVGRQIVGVLGALLVGLGVFAPAFGGSLPGNGQLGLGDFRAIYDAAYGVRWFDFADNPSFGDIDLYLAYGVIALAAIGLVLAISRQVRLLWVVGLATLAATGFQIYRVWNKSLDFAPDWDGPLDMITSGTLRLGWGFVLAVLGSLLLIIVGIMGRRPPAAGQPL